MWAHYADKHSGICFEFDAMQEPFSRAYQVVYREALVALGLDNIFDDPKGMADGVLLSKSGKWEYEDEYRMLGRDRSIDPAFSITTDGDFLPLPETALTAIIVGCSANMNAILSLVKGYAPDLHVRRAVRMPHKYQLEMAELDPASTRLE